MSVQAGIWNFDGRPVNQELFGGLCDALKRQGPDGESCYHGGNITMLYRPFHTTAESRHEKQPHTSKRNFVLTWDGRLDNREELIADLHTSLGQEFTDLAIVSAAFDRWETDCFERLVGDWAATIWRSQERELVFACDFMCIRHVFYYLKKDCVWWSTDLSPLVLLTDDKFHIDDDYIAGYFASDPGAHLTPYREIREVPPGHLVRIRDGVPSTERYWRIPTSCIRYRANTEYEEHFRHVFRQSVRRRLRSDTPILAELSGGLDSSSIVCMADQILTEKGAHTPRLDTISYFDTTEPNGDDWIYFRKVEEKRGRTGTHIDASDSGTSNPFLEYRDFIALPGHIAFGRNLESKRDALVRANGYRAAISGLGGDEFVGGIPDPTAQLEDLIVQFKFLRLARQLIAWSLIKRRPWIHLLLDALLGLVPAVLTPNFIRQSRVASWIDKEFAKRVQRAYHSPGLLKHTDFVLPTRRSYVRGILLMANKLAKHIPSPSAFAPEEIRYPYLDQDLLNFLVSIPADQLLRPGERRSLMRRSLTDIVPEEILSRRTKQVGTRTHIVTLERNWDSLEEVCNSLLSSKLGCINQNCFSTMLRKARTGTVVPIVHLMKTISLELWLRDLSRRHLIDVGPAPVTTSVGDALQVKI